MNIKRIYQGWQESFANTVLFGLVFGLTNLVSYLFLVVAGRSLLPAEFGVFNALLGLLTIGGIFASSIQVAVTREVTKDVGRDTLVSLIRAVWQIAIPGTALATIAVIPFAGRIGLTTLQVVLCGVTLLTMILGSATIGFLVGLGKVRAQADLNFFGTIARLAVGWLFMSAGFGVSGALAGYAINYLLVLILAYAKSLHVVNRPEALTGKAAAPLRIEGATVAIFVLTFAPFTLDQFMVQFFNPSLGGDYAATATIAKLAFFAAYPVTAVAYPALLALSDRRSRVRALATASAAVILIAGTLALLIHAFPQGVTQLFFGDRFSNASDHVGMLAFGIACFSLSALGAHAQIAWGGRGGMVPSVATVAFAILLFALRHGSLATVIENQVWIYALQLVLVWGLLAVTVMRSVRHERATKAAPPATGF